jgi:hypothetical protein
MYDVEVQHQRHRTRLIREVVSQLDVPILLTPVSNLPNREPSCAQPHTERGFSTITGIWVPMGQVITLDLLNNVMLW